MSGKNFIVISSILENRTQWTLKDTRDKVSNQTDVAAWALPYFIKMLNTNIFQPRKCLQSWTASVKKKEPSNSYKSVRFHLLWKAVAWFHSYPEIIFERVIYRIFSVQPWVALAFRFLSHMKNKAIMFWNQWVFFKLQCFVYIKLIKAI